MTLIKFSGVTGLGIIMAGCPNQGANIASGTSNSKTSGQSLGSTAGSDNGTTFITLTNVIKSNISPDTMIELIGQNNEIITQCPTINDCACAFSWIEADASLRSDVRQTPARVENNMMRCLFTEVPPDAKQFDVSIKILAANQSSNSLTVQINGASPSLDASIASNYIQAQRFMCRDILRKDVNTQLYQGTLLDPRLWNMSYAFNFYTTSLGADYGATASAGAGGGAINPTGFECPLIPNDPSSDPIYDLTVYSKAAVDITQPSKTALPAGEGDRTIYPADDNLTGALLNKPYCPTGTESTCEKFALNRHDFYVATFKSGIFKQPFCPVHKVANYLSANLDCTDAGSNGVAVLGGAGVGIDVMGWAAVPDQNQHCPAGVTLPPGKKWAKLWKFRTSYVQRTITEVSNPEQIGDLFCTTRNNECQSSNPGENNVASAFYDSPTHSNSVCWNAKAPTPPAPGVNQLGVTQSALNGNISAPGFGNCDSKGNAGGDGFGNYIPGGGQGSRQYSGNTGGPTVAPWEAASCTGQNNPVPLSSPLPSNFNCCLDVGQADTTVWPSLRPANFTLGGDFCNPALIGSHDASSILSTEGGIGEDVWLKGYGSRLPCLEADTDPYGNLHQKFASAFPPTGINNPYVTSVKVIDQDPRSDILYVVSPESVTFENMQSPATNSVAAQYTPYRLVKNGGPNDIVDYELVSGSDNGTDPANRLSQFPLCVLQDSKFQGQPLGGAGP